MSSVTRSTAKPHLHPKYVHSSVEFLTEAEGIITLKENYLAIGFADDMISKTIPE